MTFPGSAMARVGVKPRQSVVNPSLRETLRKPSNVDVNVACLVRSTEQSPGTLGGMPIPSIFVSARHCSALLFMKKTSRQQAVTPRLEGRKALAGDVASFWKSAGRFWKSTLVEVTFWD